jgi:hypothetical protein
MLGAGGALVIAVALLSWQNRRLAGELGATKLSIENATRAAEANLEAFNRVDELNKICIADRQADEEANRITVVELNAELAAARSRSERVRLVREEIFRDPTCEEIGAIDIAAQCPAWAGSLRERAAGFD